MKESETVVRAFVTAACAPLGPVGNLFPRTQEFVSMGISQQPPAKVHQAARLAAGDPRPVSLWPGSSPKDAGIPFSRREPASTSQEDIL